MAFWDSILDLFNTGGGGYDLSGYDPSGSEISGYSPPAPTGGGFDWGGLAGKAISGLAPLAGGLGTAALASQLFPSQNQPGQIVATDTRTAEGRAAEQARLGAFNRLEGERPGIIDPLQQQLASINAARSSFQANPSQYIVQNPNQQSAETSRLGALGTMRDELAKALSDPYYGSLSSEMQGADIQNLRRERRSGDAARGMLETGGSARREAEDIRRYRTDQARMRTDTLGRLENQVGTLSQGYQGPINQSGIDTQLLNQAGQAAGDISRAQQGFSGLGAQLLGGFQPEQLTNIPAQSQPNPWAALTTQAMAPEVMRLIRGIV